MLWDVIRVGLEDISEAFGIKENIYEKYIEGEIKKNSDLMSLIEKREAEFDWEKETPLGGAGTTLNGCVLYCLIRYFDMCSVIETGVSGGYYTSFMLAALNENNYHGQLLSLELSDNKKEVGKLVPKFKLNEGVDWKLDLGKSSLEHFKEWKEKGINHAADLYSHDSLHTMSHMIKELNEFKESKSEKFFIFIDDEKSDNFWERCWAIGAFNKPGYVARGISGVESRLNGHLGGFLYYVKS